MWLWVEVYVYREGGLGQMTSSFFILRTILMVMECTQSTVTPVWGSRCVAISIDISIRLDINYIVLS